MRDSKKRASRISYSDTSAQYCPDCLLAKLDWKISGAGSIITWLKTYAHNSPVHLNLNQMAAKAVGLPRISHVGVSYSDTAIQYRHDILYCQIRLPNLQCVIYRNETHTIWHMAGILRRTWQWLNCAWFTLWTSICVCGHRFLVHLKIAGNKWFEALCWIILKIQLWPIILRLACPGTCNLAYQLTSSVISH